MRSMPSSFSAPGSKHQFGDLTTLLKTQGGTAAAHDADRHYLLVFEQESSWVFQLPADGAVVVGRGEDAALRLEDSSVSRRHASIAVADRLTQVIDMGSQNGTLVNGERIDAPRSLVSGDTLSIGAVTLIYHASARPAQRPALLDLAALRERAAEELERALAYHRPLAVAAIALDDPAPDEDQVLDALAAELRLMDAVAWVAEDTLLLVLPEIDRHEVTARAERFLRALEGIGPVRTGTASCPQDGCDVDTLLAAARAAALGALPGTTEAAGPACHTLEIGERQVVVADPAMARLYQLVARLAQSELPVLVCGETGTGKELAVWALHQMSPRAAHPLVTLNCAAIQDTLVESELFGYERGAFSGAVTAKRGLLESASGGTVFLDEIGDLPPAAQAKLLRALETKRALRLGDLRERAIDIRVVGATNRDLAEEVAAGRFRQDLFFRLSGATLWLPPLRDRPRELPILAHRFLRDACLRGGRAPMSIAPAALRRLLAFPWPGNVRELKNVMEYLAAAVADPVVEPWHLDERLGPPAAAAAGAAPAPRARPPVIVETALRADDDDEDGGGDAEDEVTGPVPYDLEAVARPRRFRPLAEEIRELEKSRISAALSAAGGNQRLAAELLAMPLRTFVFKLRQYGLRRSDEGVL